MTQREKIKFIILRSIGNFLVLFALYGVFATFGPAFYFEVSYRIIKARGITYAVSETPAVVVSKPQKEPTATESAQIATPQATFAPQQPGLEVLLSDKKQQILTPPDTQFSILIPKIGATAKVFPNADPENEKEFLPLLKKGVAHAKGSVFPGIPGNTYLFAHSTDNWWNVGRYNAVFYLLKELKKGDEITVFFENRRYNYVVTESSVTDASDVSYLVDSRGDKSRLILQTCWPPGTTWKRYIVVAEPRAEAESL